MTTINKAINVSLNGTININIQCESVAPDRQAPARTGWHNVPVVN